MKKKIAALSGILIILVIAALAYTTLVYLPSEAAPEKKTITIVDGTPGAGVYVEVEVPVERIVSIIATDIIYILGRGDRIVGRGMLDSDVEVILPPSILELPVVAESSANPNLELILELEPDLVLADGLLSSENRKMIEDAGIPVISDMLMEPRRKTFIKNLGLILDAEEKANEFIDYETHYENLVKERIENLTPAEKPSFYFEWYMSWFSAAAGSEFHDVLVDIGGINIAAGEPVMYPTLSPEYVTEKNPDFIIRMSTYLDGEDLAAFQALRDEILSRPALGESKAVEEGNVYVIKNTVLVARRPIGLLYLAKWFHPSLFEDIDPAAIHTQMIQKFFGADLEGVFAYP